MKIARVASLLVSALLVSTGPLQAAEWKHEIAPYFMGAGLDGKTGVGPVTVDVDAGFGDILDHLEFGAMAGYRASRERFSFTLDTIYTALGGSGQGPAGFVNGNVDIDQLMIEPSVGYQFGERFVGFIGMRYNDLKTTLEARGPLGNAVTAVKDEDWIDPIVGAHYTWPFAEQWSVTLRGDIGGFGVGADFAWQGVATVRWQSSARFGVALAYSYLYMDYESGSGSDLFVYNMAMSGPALGVVFSF